MQCVSPIFVRSQMMYMPCGHCMACKHNRVVQWTVRLLHELQSTPNAVFVTLTYDDEHIPIGGTLEKRHPQLFLKRLRKSIDPLRIKYYLCGEYGETTFRPHYHAIIFGLRITDADTIRAAWNYGFSDVGTVTEASIRYVTGYISKKLYSKYDDWYKKKKLVAPYNTASNGLGLRTAQSMAESLFSTQVVHLNGTVVPMPRYYNKKLEIPRDILKKKAIEATKKRIDKLISRYGLDFFNDGTFELLDNDAQKLHYMLKRIGNFKQREYDLAAKADMNKRSKI